MERTGKINTRFVSSLHPDRWLAHQHKTYVRCGYVSIRLRCPAAANQRPYNTVVYDPRSSPTGSYNNRFVCSFPTRSTRYGHAAGDDVRKCARGKAIGKAAAAARPARANGVPLTTAWARGGEVSLYTSPSPLVRIDAAACTGVGVRSCSLGRPSRVRVGRRTGRAYGGGGGGGRDVPQCTRLCDSPCPRQFPTPSTGDGDIGGKKLLPPTLLPLPTPRPRR